MGATSHRSAAIATATEAASNKDKGFLTPSTARTPVTPMYVHGDEVLKKKPSVLRQPSSSHLATSSVSVSAPGEGQGIGADNDDDAAMQEAIRASERDERERSVARAREWVFFLKVLALRFD